MAEIVGYTSLTPQGPHSESDRVIPADETFQGPWPFTATFCDRSGLRMHRGDRSDVVPGLQLALHHP